MRIWTGTPYERWQKRLAATLFTTPVLAFGAMAGLVLLRKLYFARAKATGRAFDNVDY